MRSKVTTIRKVSD